MDQRADVLNLSNNGDRRTLSGVERVMKAFERARLQGRASLIPYFTLGYPTPDLSMEIVEAIACAEADIIELGVPFSDPLADGPTIQNSTQVALSQGVTPASCLSMVAEIRRRGVEQPLLLMGYLNPILSYGLERFVQDASDVGVDGFIIPDLPPEEAFEIREACLKRGLGLIFLIAPNTTPERISQAGESTLGFLYLVSLTGVTGARQNLQEGLEAFIRHTRELTHAPLAVGFGISTPDQARFVGQSADGVIVGSALIQEIMNGLRDASPRIPQRAESFIRTFLESLALSP